MHIYRYVICTKYAIFSSNNQTEDNYIFIASNDDELIRTYNLYMYLKIVLNVNIRLRVNIMIIILKGKSGNTTDAEIQKLYIIKVHVLKCKNIM